jgi:ribosomal protein S18 acetylase RimI-like enzyme
MANDRNLIENPVVKKIDANRWIEYRDLRLESLKSDPTAFGSSYEEEKDMTEGEWKRRINNALFALSKDRLVGMIVVVFNDRIKTKHVADIFGVYVNKEYRNRGIGKKLIEGALKIIKRNLNVTKIKLTVNPEQSSAIRLYERFGFESVGRLKNELKVHGRFYDELIMEKLL